MQDEKSPKVGENVFIAPGAVVVGEVELGEGASVWYHTVVRGDEETVTIGENTNIQDNAVLHVDRGFPLKIGKGSSIGHGAILHGCHVGDNTLVGMGAIILNGADIGNNCIVGAGALVTQNKEIPDGSLVLGNPAKVTRLLTKQEIQANRQNAQVYLEESRKHKNKRY